MSDKRPVATDTKGRRLPDTFNESPSKGLGFCGWILVIISFIFTAITFPFSVWMCIKIRYWAAQDKEAAAQRVQVSSQDYSAKLENLLPDMQYSVEVRAYNSAGYGPPSDVVDVYTKKAPPSQPPRIISSVRSGSRYIITWDHVRAMSNESTVTGYKVLYRPDGEHEGKLYSTHKHSIEVPIPRDGEYIVEVRAHSDGGDGVVSQIKISGASEVSPSLFGLLLPAFGILAFWEF